MEAPSKLHFNLDSTFFGFNSSHQTELHSRLYDLIIAGNGCWDWDTVYHLPLHIRRLWISKINAQRSKDNEEAEERANRAKNKTHR